MALYNIVDMDAKQQVGICLAISTDSAVYMEVKKQQRFNILHQTITTNCEVITAWHDVFLAWNPEE